MASKSKTAAQKSSKSNCNDDLEKWKSQIILDGNFNDVLQHFSKSWKNIDPKDALTILNTMGRFIFKIQNDPSKDLDIDIVFDLFQLCAKILGLDSAEQKNQFTVADVGNILFDLHCLSYIAFNKNYHLKLCQLTPMAVKLSKDVPNVSKNKPEVMTRLDQISKFLWRSANKIEKNKRTMQMFFDVLKMMSVVESPQSYIEMCSNVDSLIGSYSYNSEEWSSENFQTILRNIHFKNKDGLSSEEETVMENLLSKIMKHLLKASLKSDATHMMADIEAVQKLDKYFPKNTVNIAIAVYDAMVTFISNGDSTVIRNCRNYLTKDNAGQFTAKLVLVLLNVIMSSKSTWENVKVILVRDLQSLLLAALPLTPVEFHLNTAANIVQLATREFRTTPQENKWEDKGKMGITYACSAVKAVDDLLKNVNEQNFKEAMRLFQYLSYVANHLSLPNQMSYYESQQLFEVLQDHMFQCIPKILSFPDHLSQLLNLIGMIIKNSNFVLCSAGGPALQKRATKSFIFGLLGIGAVVQCRGHITEELYNTQLQVALVNWRDIRQRLTMTNLGMTDKSIVALWKKHEQILATKFNMEIIEPDWEPLLGQEILGYSEHVDYVPLVLVAGKELENLPNKSEEMLQWAQTTIAIAFSKNQEPGLEGPVTSQTLCATVITSLSEVKDKSAEQLVVLMEAYLQQYISYQKDQRKLGEKLAEIPLTTRAPPMRVGPGGESTAVESWEEAEELSQLGKELSCRLESRSIYPLANLLISAISLEKKHITQGNPSNAASALEVLECVGYICATNGHHWMALKAWGLLFSLAQSLKNKKTQLLALSMLISRYTLTSGSQEECWLQENIPLLKQDLGNSHEDVFCLRLHELCMAQCYFYSKKLEKSADIVLRILSIVEPGAHCDNKELLCRAFLLASQLLVALPSKSKHRKELLDIVVGPVEAAEWAAMQSLRNVSMVKPPERKRRDLRKVELMIDTGLWVSSLASLMGSYRTACVSLQYLLQRVQKLMLPTRVAQVLSCLGDLDLMTPDKQQLEQRLYWNQKILSLGSAIEGNKALKTPKKTRAAGSSPTRFSTKEYQLTSYCSEKCSKNSKNKGCILCKNPLYHLCKAHYALLVEGNEETCLRLYDQLRTTWVENCSRLWDLTWGNIVGESKKEDASFQGWLPMLVGPITILECRLKLGQCVVQAGKGDPRGALEIVNELKTTLTDLHHEAAPILLNWTRAQHVACEMQIRGLGGFASKLKPMIPLCAIKNIDSSSLSVSPRKVLTPRQTVPSVAPKRPGRRGAKATVDVSPVPRPEAPKLVLPEDVVEISPSTKEKTLFTLDGKTPVRRKKGKENIENYVSPKFVQPAEKVKKVTKEDTMIQSNSVVFSVFQDDKTPLKIKSKAAATSVSKTTTKSVSSTSKMKPTPSKILDFSFSPSDTPSKLFTPRAPIQVYSSASRSKKNVDATSTRKPITKSDSVIIISSSEDSPIVSQSTSRTGRVLTSSKKIVKKPVTSQFSSSSSDSPILPPKSCSKSRPIIESSPESPTVAKSTKKYKYVSSSSRAKVTVNSASSSSSNSPVLTEAIKKLTIEPSLSNPAQGVRAKQRVSSRAVIQTKKALCSESSTKKIKETIDKPKTSRNTKLNTAKTSDNNKLTNNVDNSVSQGFVLDSDVSVIENSIIEEKPKRIQATRRAVR